MEKRKLDIKPALLLNYFKIALRKIKRQKGYTLINISGLAVGLACCAIMLLWVKNEKSFDGFHANRDSIYRLIKETRTNGKETLDARIPFPLAETVLGKIPEVKNYTRYQGVDGWKINYGDKFFYNDFLSTADSSFFEIFTFPFVKGDPKTALTDRNSIVVSESMARKYFGDDEPMGKVLTMHQGRYTFTVTGVIKDFHQTSLRKPVEPMILRFTNSTSLCLRINPARTQETISFIEKTKKGYNPDPDRPVRYEILDERINKFYNSEKKVEVILSVFTVIALFTACLGLIGLASFMAEKRTREIGLRKIFGASVGGMVWLQSWEFSKWILISGVIAGPLAYWAAGNWLSSFAYHFNPGIGILLVTLSVTLFIAIVVVGYQSLKAAMANPVDSLRHE